MPDSAAPAVPPEPGAPQPNGFSPRTRWIGGTIVVAIVVVAVILSLTLPRASDGGGTSSGPRASSAAPLPSESAVPTGSASGTPAPPVSGTPDAPAPTGQPAPVSTPIEAPAEPVPGVAVRIESLEAVQGEAQGPGEISGPAIRFAVVVENTTGDSVALGTVVVNLDFGSDRTPGSEIAKPGGAPLPTGVAAGATVEGVYLFSVPTEARDLVNITVDYSVDAAPVIFTGPAPR